jgi:hypothetical protein
MAQSLAQDVARKRPLVPVPVLIGNVTQLIMFGDSETEWLEQQGFHASVLVHRDHRNCTNTMSSQQQHHTGATALPLHICDQVCSWMLRYVPSGRKNLLIVFKT